MKVSAVIPAKKSRILSSVVLDGQGVGSCMSALASLYVVALKTNRKPCVLASSLKDCEELFGKNPSSFADSFSSFKEKFTIINNEKLDAKTLTLHGGPEGLVDSDFISSHVTCTRGDQDVEITFQPWFRQWSEYQDEILELFKFDEEIVAKAKSLIPATKRPLVGVSLRLEYYKKYNSGELKPDEVGAHLALSPDYYTYALDLFTPPCFPEGVDFLFFSDDIELAKELAPLLRGILIEQYASQGMGGRNLPAFFYADRSSDPFAGICALSLCDHVINSNSSFSFWGSMLNANKHKKIVCPEFWMHPRKKGFSINGCWYPPEWHSLPIC
jgi:hypothetical protein